jgi:Domain of unknown function (DUF222)/HNH endonuclease
MDYGLREMSYLRASVKYMFDVQRPSSGPFGTIPIPSGITPAPDRPPDQPDPAPPAPVPLERLEAQICELAGHLTAATCRFLILIGDFDDRRGWASWDMPSCAAWLSWKCQMSSGTAREHVRVARALRHLPSIRGEFAAGRLSYAKVRALTRIATPENEDGLAEIAGPMTGNQLERFARAHRQVSQAEDAAARVQRRLTWRFEEDGSLAGTFRLPPLQAAALLKALRAAAGDLEHPHNDDLEHPHNDAEPDVSAETPADGKAAVETSSALADALVAIAEAYCASQVAAADDPDAYQVIVHVGTDVIAADGPAGVSAETPAAKPPGPGHPAHPARCHVEDGPAISASTARMLACTATLSWMLHDHDGTLLDVGRRRRRPTAALRRAARERDKCRCRFPGCESRRVDLHHIQYWSNGGRTKLANLISLCKYHHKLVHDRGYLIDPESGGAFIFYRPDGAAIPASPPLPPADGTIEGCHDADITPDTIIPAWYGERLDLDHAIYVCLANAENRARRRDQGQRQQSTYQRDQADQPEPYRPMPGPVNVLDWIRQQTIAARLREGRQDEATRPARQDVARAGLR